MSAKTERNNIFVSYSHKDKKWLNRLQVHLRPLARDGIIDLWDDSRIESGSIWRKEIQEAIGKANVAVLLVSPDFLASDFISNNELPALLKKAEEEGTVILSIVISHCRFEKTSISQFQAVHDVSKPLASQSPTRQDKIFVDLARRVEHEFSKDLLDEVENDIKDLDKKDNQTSSTSESFQDFFSAASVSTSIFNRIQDRTKEYNLLTGLSTGFRELDTFTSGLQPSELILVCARQYMGASVFVQNIALNTAILENKVVAYFSLKANKEKIITQMICAEAKVDEMRFISLFLARDEWARIGEAIASLSEAHVLINDEHDISVQDIRSKLKKSSDEGKKIDLVIIDNLQFLLSSQRTKNEDYSSSQLAYELKSIAKEFGIPVMVYCYLPPNSSYTYSNRPTLSNLEKLGGIEEFADLSILVHREEYYTPIEENVGAAEIIVTKHDSQTKRLIKLAFLKEFNKFTDAYLEEPDSDLKIK